MTEASKTTFGFVDHGGLYLPLARKLAEQSDRLVYWESTNECDLTINRAVIGDSFPPDDKMLVVDDIWDEKSEIDVWVFPDSFFGGMQAELRSQGIPVWGSGAAGKLEQSRVEFLKVLSEQGLEVPPQQRVVGLDELRREIEPRQDLFIKISKYRGTMETKHWRSYDEDAEWLDFMAVLLGGTKNLVPFYVCENIESDFELGGDTYCVDGQFPSVMLDGYEHKDRCYLAKAKHRAEMPEQIQAVLEAFGPVLGSRGHANFWSMEIRTDGDKFYFIDPTPRAPMPGTASQMELYSNLADIIIYGAYGALLEPELVADYSAECALMITPPKAPASASVLIPEEIRQWVKLSGNYTVDGKDWFPPSDLHEDGSIGWLIAIGNSPEEAVSNLLEHASKLPEGVTARTAEIGELLGKIEQAEKEGIEFTEKPLPEPAIVMEEQKS